MAGPVWTAAAAASGGWEGGFSWWQAAGGALAVFALLLIFLRLLARLHAPQRRGRAALLAVWPLGPRREVEVVRLGEEVHYVYRREGGLVLLRTRPLAEWEAAPEAAAAPAPWWRRLLPLGARPAAGPAGPAPERRPGISRGA